MGESVMRSPLQLNMEQTTQIIKMEDKDMMFMNREVKKFVKVCKLDKVALKNHLYEWLKTYYDKENIINQDGFLYARGTDPVCLTAHMDTVHHEVIKNVSITKNEDGKTVISSPQGIGGDDRCGIYMIKRILKETNLRPTILFCEDEEIGGVGSDKFCLTPYLDELRGMLFIIELDRANRDDVVFYDCDNRDFVDFCEQTTNNTESYGSFSDISNLCPDCKVAGVNISCGYYKAHTLQEYVIFEEMVENMYKTIKLIEEGIKQGKQYEYVERKRSFYGYGYGYGYNSYKGIYAGSGYYWNGNSKKYEDDDEEEGETYVFVLSSNEEIIGTSANSLEEALGAALMDNPTVCYADIIDYYMI